MSDKISDEVFDTLPKKPNFLLIVILSGVTILALFAAAYLLLSEDGKKLLHGLNSTAHRTSNVFPAMRPLPAANIVSAERSA